jgi:hypothetical protein
MNAISFTTSTPHSVVHLYHLNSCLVLARIEFHHNVGIGSVSFLFNEIVSCVLFHLHPCPPSQAVVATSRSCPQAQLAYFSKYRSMSDCNEYCLKLPCAPPVLSH